MCIFCQIRFVFQGQEGLRNDPEIYGCVQLSYEIVCERAHSNIIFMLLSADPGRITLIDRGANGAQNTVGVYVHAECSKRMALERRLTGCTFFVQAIESASRKR